LISKYQREDLTEVKKDKEPPGRLRYFGSKEEANRLIEGCRGSFRALVIVALHTGMRKGELLNLTWANADLDQGFIHIGATKNGEVRSIPMNETVWTVFSNLRKENNTSWVFHDEQGQPFRDTHKKFLWACKRAKIQDFRFHDLRHTFASWLVMDGVPLGTVSHLLGHKSILMTMRYSHLSPEHRMGALRSLDKNLTVRGLDADFGSPLLTPEEEKHCVSI
jgi:integrase